MNAPAPKSTAADPAARPTVEEQRRDRRVTNRSMKGYMYIGIGAAALLLLLLMAWAVGWIGGPPAAATPDRDLILADEGSQEVLGAGDSAAPPVGADTVATVGAPPGPAPAVGERFVGWYDRYGGVRLLGYPVSPPLTVNGREVQWFERARLEHWPEHAGTPYEVQLGRLGAEYTAGREFSRQTYFASRPDLRYFPETGHAVGGAFLAFYDRYGGLDVLGYPISEEFDEVLADGRAYRVQYFERARLEYHPELAGTENEVQAGLLGAAIYRNEARPNTVQPAPTPVPMP